MVTPARPARRGRWLVAIPIAALAVWFCYLWLVSGVLPSVEKHPDGSTRAEGLVRRSGFGAYKRTGYWVTYHPGGDKKAPGPRESEGIYAGGVKDGEWRYWNKRGELTGVETYERGQLVGPAAQGLENPSRREPLSDGPASRPTSP
jgi:hypothetical protein